MSTFRLVNQGEEQWFDLILAIGYTLCLFTNDVAHSESLVEGGFTEATFTGYSAAALTGGSWVTTPGDPTTASYAQQTFSSSANQTPQVIYGYYLVRTSDGALQGYEKFDASVTVQFDTDYVRVTPQLTLADTTD